MTRQGSTAEERAYHASWMREWRKKNPDATRARSMKYREAHNTPEDRTRRNAVHRVARARDPGYSIAVAFDQRVNDFGPFCGGKAVHVPIMLRRPSFVNSKR